MKTKEASRNLKVAMLIRNFSSSAGGAEKYCVELTRQLSKNNEIHIFSQNIIEEVENIHYHKLRFSVKKPRFFNQFLFYIESRILTKKYNFDIIHSHDLLTFADFYTIHVPTIRFAYIASSRIQKILSLASPRKLTYLWLEKKQMEYRDNKRIISVSRLLEKNVLSSYPKTEKISAIVPPGIHPNSHSDKFNYETERLAYGIKNNEKVILFIGHGFKRKGLQELILAVNQITDHQYRLVIVGRGNIKDIDIPNSSLKNKLLVLGEVKNMQRIFSISDLLVHPTKGDTFGMSVLEAMSNKIPVIVSNANYCGLAAELSNNEAALIDDPNNPDEIYRLINEILSDNNLSTRLSEKGYAFAKKMTWSETGSKTYRLYLEILNEG